MLGLRDYLASIGFPAAKRGPVSKQYIMKGLDDALWHAVKVKAAEQQISKSVSRISSLTS